MSGTFGADGVTGGLEGARLRVMRFTTTITSSGKNITGIPVPDEVVEALGGGRRPLVTVTVGGHTYPSAVASMGGRFMISLSKENRLAAGVAAGDEVEVDVELDTAPRQVSVPEDLAAALDAEPGLREAFERLAPSHRKEHVRAIEEAKAPETRERRIDKAVAMLRDRTQ